MTDVHCKPYNHVRTVISTHAPTQLPTATFVPEMPCHEPRIGKQPGVLLALHPDRPEDGLHLLPDAVAGVPNDLRHASSEATGVETVGIEHPFKTVYKLWGAWTPQQVMGIADMIEAAWPDDISLSGAVAQQLDVSLLAQHRAEATEGGN